jgi:hypothetical protein
MPRPFMLLATLLLAATTGAAHAEVDPVSGPADCRVRVTAMPTGWIIQGYDPFGSGMPEATFSATFLNEGSVDCRFSRVFQIDQPPFGLSTGTGNPVRYVLLDLSEGQDVTPRGGRSQTGLSAAEMVIAPKEMRTVIYKLVADPDDITRPGTFTQDVILEAQDQTFRTLGGARVALGLNVLPSARIGLSGAYTVNEGRAMVDLGELREGPAPVPLHLRVQSIGTYEIAVTSENSGRLRLGSSEWFVPYSIAIGGKSVNLAAGGTMIGQSGERMQIDTLPIQFFIGDTDNRRAGVYADLVSISVTAR